MTVSRVKTIPGFRNRTMHALTTGIWTLPTSSEQSFSFALVVSAVAFVYPACFGLFALANL